MALERLPGRAAVKLETEEARVAYEDNKQTPEKLVGAIDKLGFKAALRAVTAAPKPTLYVDGLKDQAAVQKVETALRAVKGVKGIRVDPGLGEVFVEFEAATVSPRDLVAVVEAAGLRARLP